MITFFCSTISCLNMYLGSGYILTQSGNAVIYYNFQKTYVCSRQSTRFECRTTDRITVDTSMDFLLGNR